MADHPTMHKGSHNTHPLERALKSRATTTRSGVSEEALRRVQDIEAQAARDIGAIGGGENLKDIISSLQEPTREPTPVRDAFAKALGGAASGIAATPRDARFNPVLGGILGGIRGAGQDLDREARSRISIDSPRQKLLQSIREEQAKEAVREPGRKASKLRQLTKESAGFRSRAVLTNERLRQISEFASRATGVSPTVADKALKRAERNLLLSGRAAPGSPGYAEALLAEQVKEIRSQGAINVKGARGVRPAPRTPAPARPSDPLGNILFPR